MSRLKAVAFLQFLSFQHWIASSAVVSVLLLNGCATMQTRPPVKANSYFDRTAVTSIQASLTQGPSMAPGEESLLVVTATAQDGSVSATEGAGKGKIRWKDLVVTATLAEVNQKGRVSLPQDPRISDGKVPHISVAVLNHPEIHAELDIPLRYDYAFSSKFSGRRGSSGTSGMDGRTGSSGSSGSLDPKHPTAGKAGSNGSNGSDGRDGGRGGDGPPVEVRVALRSACHPLLQVAVSAENQKDFFLVDPQGGSLFVSSEGGRGGSGGRGGRGGRGGNGGSGMPSGMSGHRGSDGRNGSDGRPGNGGSITVTYDPEAKPFLDAIHLLNPRGPTPMFREEPVGALW
jgi:hypothetical protein